jgi:transcriptional regulator with XRE-family HTH domain
MRQYSKKTQGEKAVMNRKYAEISKEEIVDLQEKTGLSQRLIAEKTGISQPSVLHYSKGVSRVPLRYQEPIFRLALQYQECLLYPKAIAALAPQDDFSRQAIEIIQREKLSPKTLRVWKSRGAIPKKYLEPKPQEPRISLLDLDEPSVIKMLTEAEQELGEEFNALVKKRTFRNGMSVGYYLIALRGLRREIHKKRAKAATPPAHTPPPDAHPSTAVSTP